MQQGAKPLEGILVLDFSQFLSGPSAALRLADMGARVIKIEKPDTGDICRTLYISNLELDGDSTLFHSINRNKESYAADLKNKAQLEQIQRLIRQADVMIQNFRPGVMERLGLHYEQVKEWNPRLVYGQISGYGNDGPWKDKPGQDLLVQSVSGLAWLNGAESQPPLPLGLAVVDMAAGAHLVQGILAGLYRRGITGNGCHIEVSLLDSILDFQFTELTAFLNGGGVPIRSRVNHAHVYRPAPYGVYKTADGYLALASGSVPELGLLFGCDDLAKFVGEDSWYEDKEAINAIIAEHLAEAPTVKWLELLESGGFECAEVLTWESLHQEAAFQDLDMIQTVYLGSGAALNTTRCPIRFDNTIYKAPKGSPKIGEDNESINQWLEATFI
ncbi:CaiB/BaiF CoA transferase family protein [Paenibacillus sp. UNC451MF]|uniref:CaiB/BaiF CoA transferase family protein n=1 Tax=Paenibacillus sp. UNC451MF TaxID=1449063 RepID=UPI00048F4E6F|nr:CaiB/BaiF CoA-transferase family protein [Paenibacillus sp. UNC451MF]